MKNLKLVCLIVGKKKDGKGDWFKATLLGHNAENKPVTAEFFLDPKVGEKMVREGIIEDVPVKVSFGLDDYLRPSIVDISRADEVTAPGPKKAV